MENPKVSIIIPVYNGEKYIETAIRSALDQTYENIEIIVINDGSTDKTEEICTSYGNKIKYYKKENGGVSTVLNMALKKMTGEYFSWLSHDDFYFPNKIEEEIKNIEEKTIVFSDYGLIDENGYCYDKVIMSHEVVKMHNEYALLKGYINGITLLIPKEAFEECGTFDEKLRCTQDYDMWFRMLLKGYRFKHIPKILASTRIHGNQVTNTNPKVITEGNELWINMMKNFPLERKKEINNTEYNFYRQMKKVLGNTPYDEAMKFAEKKMKQIRKDMIINSDNVLVSVIMPIYDENMEVLNRSISSVLNQTHKNLELIIINDNPKVQEKSIIDSISKDCRIKYLENGKNMGASYSRNRGINIAIGEYIVFLDGDDEFCQEKIKVQLDELLLCKENFSHTSYTRCCNGTKEIMNSGKLDEYIYRRCIYDCRIATPTVMIKREFLNTYNIKFDESIEIGEDTCFWLDILTKTSAVGIDKALTNVYTDQNSAAYNDKKLTQGIGNIVAYINKSNILNHYEMETAIIKNTYENLLNKIKNPKVSIIIPVYNGENYIQLAIDSALRQTYENTEVIVVDDGSKDKTESICMKYGNKIKYIKKKNGGVSTALNIGIKNMTGDYFSWLSHDDLYLPEKVDIEIKYLKKNNLLESKNIVYSDYIFIDEKGKIKDYVKLDSDKLNSDSAYAVLTGAFNGISLLIPKKAFDEAGNFDEKLRCVQDNDLWFKMYKLGYKFNHIPNCIVATRIHEKQVTNTNPNMKKEGTEFWINTIEYFSDSEKVRLFGSIYNYYYNLYKTFKDGPFYNVEKFCKEKIDYIEQKISQKIKDTKVSIILPYEDRKNCIESLESILNQTHKNIEIMLINNGNTKNDDIIESLVNKHEIIKYSKYDEKISNFEIYKKAVNNAEGDYIVLFDKNSIMDEKRIEVQLTKHIASETVISHMSYYQKNMRDNLLISAYSIDGIVPYKLINGDFINLSTVMIQKEYLVNNSHLFEKKDDIPITLLFLVELLKNNRIVAITDPLTTTYGVREIPKYNVKEWKSIVKYISESKELQNYNALYKTCLDKYIEAVQEESGMFIEREHNRLNMEIARYEYMLTNEFKNVTKIRKIVNKIKLKEEKLLYEFDNNAIMNGKINKIYRKIKR